MTFDIETLKYPIGNYKRPEEINENVLKVWTNDISEFPKKLRKETEGLNDEQLDTPYRPEGWTIRQVVHHCADSHMNSIVRIKWTLTEDKPTIKPYYEARWAELADTKLMPIANTLTLIEALHEKWVYLLNSMNEEDWQKTYFHPESGREFTLGELAALYAWHCNHHLAHITSLKQRMNW